MCCNLNQYANNTGDFNQSDEIIRVGDKLLTETTNDWTRYAAIQILCLTYLRIGDLKKSREYALKAPIYWITFCDAEDNNTDSVVDNLNQAIYHAKKFDLLSDYKHTSFLVNRHKFQHEKVALNSPDSILTQLYAEIEDKRFDFCKKDEKFKQIKE